jgi:hypothetical protein
MKKCFLLGANGFATKGYSFENVQSLAGKIGAFLDGKDELPGARSAVEKDLGIQALD